MIETEVGAILREQRDYYRARAREYDEWWLRRGRYDRGPERNALWFADAAAVEAALAAFGPAGRILEIACGTGIWTALLLPYASELVALDASAEMLAVNAERLRSPRVRYVEADVFAWQPEQCYDTVFFGFWLSHVPPEQFESFWERVRSCLAPDGRVFFVDSRRDQTSTATDHELPGEGAATMVRRLNDGREFRIYKLFYDARGLGGRLAKLDWRAELAETAHYFVYGAAAVA